MLFHVKLVAVQLCLEMKAPHAYKQDEGYRNEQSQKPERSHDIPKKVTE